MSLIRELRTRNVLKVSVVYAASAWILLQLLELLTTYMAWPDWVPQVFLVLLIVGFVPTFLAAWAFEITPEGVKLDRDVERPDQKPRKRKKGRKLDTMIVIALALGLAVWIFKEDYEAKEAEVAEAEQAALAEPEPGPDLEIVQRTDIDPRSIAVLPFDSLSPNPADVHFADGVHDDLLSQLARIEDFKVIARASVQEYRDSTRELGDIANELGVARVMEGTVQKLGERVRINVQLLDPWAGSHLWAETFDRELNPNNIFEIQTEIAQAIAAELEANLSDDQVSELAEAPTENNEAYTAYQEGRRWLRGDTKGDFDQALAQFNRAVELDPGFALAWIGLARVHMNYYWSYGGDPAEVQKARQAIDNAKALNDDFPELFLAEGFYWYWAHLDYERALYNLDKAITLSPGMAEAHMWRGWASRRAGLYDQTLEAMEESMSLDPRRSFHWAELGYTYLFLHRMDEAREAAQESLNVNPDDFWGKTNLADVVLMTDGDIDQALALTADAHDTVEYLYWEQYLDNLLYARQFEEALTAGRATSDDLEIQRNGIILREMRAAHTLFLMWQKEEARQAANAAKFRLRNLEERLGKDFRLDMAHAWLSPVLEEPPEQLDERIAKAKASRPDDKIQDIQFEIRYARIYGMAGRADKTIEHLEPLLGPPSETTVHTVDLDPAFDAVRNHVDFVAMMERHR